MWGSFQSAAQQHVDTAQVWSDLRSTAAQWERRARGLPPAASVEEEQQLGREILSREGITAPNVAVWRAQAGRWRQARENLNNLGRKEQITSTEIYSPPWAKTSAPGVEPQYKVRVQWQYESEEGEPILHTEEYQLPTPLTHREAIEDMLTKQEGPISPPLGVMAAVPPSIAGLDIIQV